MSYQGYVPKMLEHLMRVEKPTVLEIGIEYGQCSLPLITNLLVARKAFEYVGIDVLLRETFTNTVGYFATKEDQIIAPLQMNSLDALPKLIELKKTFDLILVDGDHNYYTVSKELEMIGKHLCNENTVIVVDDYSGKWSTNDLYYANRTEYANVQGATPFQQTDLKGVKPAVDEFVAANPEWQIVTLMQGEPVMLVRGGVALPDSSAEKKSEQLWDW